MFSEKVIDVSAGFNMLKGSKRKKLYAKNFLYFGITNVLGEKVYSFENNHLKTVIIKMKNKFVYSISSEILRT